MFLEEIERDKRPFMAVCAPSHNFVLKYFDRLFDMRISDRPEDALPGTTAFVIKGVDECENDDARTFRRACQERGLRIVTLRVPMVIGTGMTGTPMRLARGVSRGTMLRIKDNEARWSMIHATDIANVARLLSQNDDADQEYVISGAPVRVNDLIEALGQRIKDKRVGTISRRLGRIVYGKVLFDLLTTDNVVNPSVFAEKYPDFEFVNPAEYMKSHVYDDESL